RSVTTTGSSLAAIMQNTISLSGMLASDQVTQQRVAGEMRKLSSSSMGGRAERRSVGFRLL
ncbi:MAG TPA: hypothetical protein VKP00_13860, partial [Gemmatimonadaceae bacterium]|nr:hypothetical protein [Gemmatimonadaceae bacterium]